MKILVDQNISFRAVRLFEQSTEIDWISTQNTPLASYSDHQLWNYARIHEFDAILSSDQDMYKILQLRGIPPKLIWLRAGNTNRFEVSAIINQKIAAIKNLIDNDRQFLILYRFKPS